MIHGFGASTDHWRFNIPVLSEKYDVHAIDLLGFGKIANFAHLGGLISGIMCGYLFQMYNNRKNYE